MLTFFGKYTKLFFAIFFLIFITVIFWVTMQGIDPDFGWHLRMGQLILSKGIPVVDPFSYTMPSYPFVDHEWLTNVCLAILYPRMGIVGLSILFTFSAFAALALQFPVSLKKWAVIPLFLSIGTFSIYLGIRPQILSWLFYSILLTILLHKKVWHRFRFLLPVLFLLWANLHGGFPIGIVTFCLFLVVSQFVKKKIVYIDWFLFLCSLAVTFINPYGYRMWWEVWVSLSDGSLRWSIQEWLPALFVMNYYFLLLLPLSVAFIFCTSKHFSLFELALFVILLCFGLSSARNVPFWIILALPMTTKAFAYFAQDIEKIPFASRRFSIAYIFYFGFCIVALSPQVYSSLTSDLQSRGDSFYPNSAILYLQKHPTSGQIFSTYNWGGYLIWKLPDKKVFIDGRMPSWRRHSAPSGESKYAFDDYKHILSGRTMFASVASAYHVDTVLINRSFDDTFKTSFLENLVSNLFHLEEAKPDVFIAELKKMGMKEVYKDKVAVIYRR